MAKNEMACHEKGESTGLTVNALLERLFKLNETTSHVNKYTDKAIADFVQLEFSHSVVTQAEVNKRRRQYNIGTAFWGKRGPATYEVENITGDRPFSYQYNAAGEKQPINYNMYKRESQASNSGPAIDIDNLRESIINAVNASIQSEVSSQLSFHVSGLRSELKEGQLKAEDIQSIVQGELAKERPSIIVNVPERKHTIKLDGKKVHAAFHKVLKKVKAGVPVLLVGPAGSGKTYLASQVAKALGLRFTFNSMSEGVSESSLLGRVLPDDKGNWTYRPAPFVVSYTQGGVHLLDEVDASDPNLMVQINAAIANGKLAIPFKDGAEPLDRHADSIIIAAANTYGNGADRQYVGRNQLDAATLNRFQAGMVEVDYDENLESSIAHGYLDQLGGTVGYAGKILGWAWAVRDVIRTNKLRRIMATRNIEDFCKLFIAGETLQEICDGYFLGWTTDEKSKVTTRL
jgi:cobaltochelatase CobS